MPVLDQFYPFDRPFGAPASAALWGKMAQQFVPDGVLLNYLSNFNATISTGQITVQNGGVMIHGYYGEIQNPQTFAVGTNGMVVIGVDMTGESVSCYYKDGVTDYNGLTQSATLWEIPLYQITGTTLVDKRSYINPGRGMAWGVGGGSATLNPSQAIQFNLGNIDITHTCGIMLLMHAQFGMTNASQGPQNAFWYGTYQFGQPDGWNTGNLQAFYWPGGSGITGYAFGCMAAMMWCGPASPGKKAIGVHVGCGSGAGSIQVANLGVQVLQIGQLTTL